MSQSVYYIIAVIVAILGFGATLVAGIGTLIGLTYRTGKLVSRLESNQSELDAQVNKLISVFHTLTDTINEHGERITVLETKASVRRRKK